MPGNKPSVFRFADLEVREREFSLTKAGEIAQVEPKAFRVLLFLLHNPQKLITKEELLNAVWGETAVSENSLTRSIALLRHLLGDDTHQPRYIETVATVGYRFVCPVEVVEDVHGGLAAADSADVPSEPDGDHTGAAVEAASAKAAGRANRIVKRRWLAGAVVVAVGLLAAAIWYLHRPLPRPRHGLYPDHPRRSREALGGTDGSRLYFGQLSPNFIAQVAITGGEIAQIPVAEPEHYRLYPQDVSPDGSSLLIFAEQKVATRHRRWRPFRCGMCASWEAQFAAWERPGKPPFPPTETPSPTRPRKATSGWFEAMGPELTNWPLPWQGPQPCLVAGRQHHPVYQGRQLWEMSSNGSDLHQLLPDWHASSRKCCGRWTPDGSFYLFLSRESNRGEPDLGSR